jgi:hypothetical protein
MSKAFHVYWGRHNGRVKLQATSDFISPFSIVLVTVSEGQEPNNTNPNFRFVGNANIRVENISPTQGSVWFIVSVDWGEPLHIYTDIVILDEVPLSIIRAPGT